MNESDLERADDYARSILAGPSGTEQHAARYVAKQYLNLRAREARWAVLAEGLAKRAAVLENALRQADAVPTSVDHRIAELEAELCKRPAHISLPEVSEESARLFVQEVEEMREDESGGHFKIRIVDPATANLINKAKAAHEVMLHEQAAAASISQYVADAAREKLKREAERSLHPKLDAALARAAHRDTLQRAVGAKLMTEAEAWEHVAQFEAAIVGAQDQHTDQTPETSVSSQDDNHA